MELSPGISSRSFVTFLFIIPNSPIMIDVVLVFTFQDFSNLIYRSLYLESFSYVLRDVFRSDGIDIVDYEACFQFFIADNNVRPVRFNRPISLYSKTP